jgi:3-oxoacyl-[acyl-carrier-protein] synthase II
LSKRRVVITGLGIVSPVGSTVDTAWRNVLAGNSGIGPITRFDVSAFPVRFHGPVADFNAEQYLSAKELRKMDPFMHYGYAAAADAIKDSGVAVSEANAHRIGVIMGAGIGGLDTIEENYRKYAETQSPKRISPFFVPGSIINMISGHVSINFKLTGPNLATVTACTTSTHAIGLAMRLIQYGDADVMIAGAGEMATTPLGLGSFCQARALSTRNDDPRRASRPWDRDRDGFVLSDGAGAVLLEEYEHAKQRGAKIYAELVGFGMSGDAHHITAPPENGEDVQYVNAHATSTELGDLAETIAMKRCFGEHSAKLAVSSTKSMTGHLLGAAGAVEAIFSILAIRDQVAPPTINLDNPGEGCDLDYVPKTARRMPIRVALSNSFGFGGTNGSLIFSALD